jgi:hypothetical protein
MDVSGVCRVSGRTPYNRVVRFHHILLAVAACVALGACSRGIQSEAAVKQGVLDYLSSRADLNISSMQVDVASVSFRQNEADAMVSFRPKGGNAASGMQMKYTLEKKGNRWVVKGKGAGHGMNASPNPAGAGSQMPPGHPPMTGGAPPK